MAKTVDQLIATAQTNVTDLQAFKAADPAQAQIATLSSQLATANAQLAAALSKISKAKVDLA